MGFLRLPRINFDFWYFRFPFFSFVFLQSLLLPNSSIDDARPAQEERVGRVGAELVDVAALRDGVDTHALGGGDGREAVEGRGRGPAERRRLHRPARAPVHSRHQPALGAQERHQVVVPAVVAVRDGCDVRARVEREARRHGVVWKKGTC